MYPNQICAIFRTSLWTAVACIRCRAIRRCAIDTVSWDSSAAKKVGRISVLQQIWWGRRRSPKPSTLEIRTLAALPLSKSRLSHSGQNQPATMHAHQALGSRCHLRPAAAARPCRLSRSRAVLVSASHHKIAVLPGDGIGPEITKVALRVLVAAGKAGGASFSFTEAHVGGAAIDATGVPLPQETLDICRANDAVLLAAIGGCAPPPSPAAAVGAPALCPARRALRCGAPH